jgi:hypothetical protein
MEVGIDGIEHPREAGAIVPSVTVGRDEKAARRIEAFPDAIVSFNAEMILMALGACAFLPRLDADAVIFRKDLAYSADL